MQELPVDYESGHAYLVSYRDDDEKEGGEALSPSSSGYSMQDDDDDMDAQPRSKRAKTCNATIGTGVFCVDPFYTLVKLLSSYSERYNRVMGMRYSRYTVRNTLLLCITTSFYSTLYVG